VVPVARLRLLDTRPPEFATPSTWSHTVQERSTAAGKSHRDGECPTVDVVPSRPPAIVVVKWAFFPLGQRWRTGRSSLRQGGLSLSIALAAQSGQYLWGLATSRELLRDNLLMVEPDMVAQPRL